MGKPLDYQDAKERFYQHLRLKGYAPKSFERFETILNHFEVYLKQQGKDLRGVTSKDLTNYYQHVSQEKSRRYQTCRTYYTSLRSFFEFLVNEELLLIDPIEGTLLNMKRSPKRLPEVLTAKEMRKLLNSSFNRFLLGARDQALMELIYSSGLRVSEIIRIKKEDVGLGDGLVMVRQGKGRKDRLIPLGYKAKETITKYLQECRPQLARQPAQELFLTRKGGRLAKTTIEGLVKKYAKIARIKKRVYPHLLRHTLATHLLERGACLSIVQGILGHVRLETTQIYTQIRPVQLKRWYNRCHPQSKRLKEISWKSPLS